MKNTDMRRMICSAWVLLFLLSLTPTYAQAGNLFLGKNVLPHETSELESWSLQESVNYVPQNDNPSIQRALAKDFPGKKPGFQFNFAPNSNPTDEESAIQSMSIPLEGIEAGWYAISFFVRDEGFQEKGNHFCELSWENGNGSATRGSARAYFASANGVWALRTVVVQLPPDSTAAILRFVFGYGMTSSASASVGIGDIQMRPIMMEQLKKKMQEIAVVPALDFTAGMDETVKDGSEVDVRKISPEDSKETPILYTSFPHGKRPGIYLIKTRIRAGSAAPLPEEPATWSMHAVSEGVASVSWVDSHGTTFDSEQFQDVFVPVITLTDRPFEFAVRYHGAGTFWIQDIALYEAVSLSQKEIFESFYSGINQDAVFIPESN